MRLVHIIPIAKTIRKETLSYFTKDESVENGALVSIHIRGKEQLGVVSSSSVARDSKTSIKKLDYTIQKVGSLHALPFFSTSFMEAVLETSQYFVSTSGAVLYATTPPFVRSNIDTLAKIYSKAPTGLKSTPKNRIHKTEQLVMQAPTSARISQYKSMIRETFARGESLFICAPTVKDVEYISRELQKGIESYVVALHGSMGKNVLLDGCKNMLTNTHPLVIIAQASFLSVPRNDIKTIIIERESSRSYKQIVRPFVDMRISAQIFAKTCGARIIYADMPLRVETQWRLDELFYDRALDAHNRMDSVAENVLVDMREKKKNGSQSQKSSNAQFSSISRKFSDLIACTEKNDERMFVFVARRGIAPTTICEDCGHTVTCNSCSTPVVLHKSTPTNVFVCHKCGISRSAAEICSVCRGWRLRPIGIGVDRVAKEIETKFPSLHITAIDSATATKPKMLERAVDDFYNTSHSVLVGTEGTLPYIQRPIDHVVVASVDSLLSLPDPNIYERVFWTLIALQERSRKTFLIQTRQPESDVVSCAIEGAVRRFYDLEIENRRLVNYPPFTKFIKLSIIGTKNMASKTMKEIVPALFEYSPRIYPAFTAIMKNKYTLNALISVDPHTWPDKKLSALLANLPVQVSVDVDPVNTL